MIPVMKMNPALLVLSLMILVGCDELQQPKSQAKQPELPPKVVHHFDPIARSEGSLAVDTATGQMCKTWDWVCTQPTYYSPYTKKFVDNQSYGINCSAIATMPTCKSISDGQ
jgi:hypothetical protein